MCCRTVADSCECLRSGSVQTRIIRFVIVEDLAFDNSDDNSGGFDADALSGNGGDGGGRSGDGSFLDYGGSDGSGSGSLEETIPGVPGDDYPIFAEVPETSFICDGLVEGGYYADPEAECQAFHICAADGTGGLTKYSFLCPNGTIFQQQYFVCDWWFNVDCSLAEDLYYLNEEVAAERDAFVASEQSDAGASEQPGQQNTGRQLGGQGGRSRGAPEPGQSGSGQRGSSARGQSRTRGGNDQQQYVGTQPRASSQRGSSGGQRGQAGQRGQVAGGRRYGGRGQSSTRGAQSGYLAPGSGVQPGGAADADVIDAVAADAGYGAPGDTFEGAGDFPLLTEYARNTRELEHNSDSEQEELMTKTA